MGPGALGGIGIGTIQDTGGAKAIFDIAVAQ
jgi:hypothetical protein